MGNSTISLVIFHSYYVSKTKQKSCHQHSKACEAYPTAHHFGGSMRLTDLRGDWGEVV